MLGSAILETAVGLVFIYLIMSIVGTAVVEAYSGLFNCRGAYLKKWIRRALGPGKANDFYKSPLIASLRRPSVWGHLGHPSYIPEKNFAEALAYFLAGNNHTTDVKAVADAASKLKRAEVSDVIPILAEKSNGNFDTFLSEVGKWFTGSQDMVSGWFKVTSIRILLVFGLLIACVCNVDTIQIVDSLYRQTGVRETIAAEAGKSSPGDSIKELRRLESAGLIGWGDGGFKKYWEDSKSHNSGANEPRPQPPIKAAGFLLTTLAMSLGAPYWFEVLNKMNSAIRATGPKPQTQEPAKPGAEESGQKGP
jgi:hypothetical protein